MNFPKKPNYSNSYIDKLGNIIRTNNIKNEEYTKALREVNRWRISHEYPMRTFNVTLIRKARSVCPDAIVARRLKRLSTIIEKISSREMNMRLSRMQDIGGVRAIVRNVEQVNDLLKIYTEPGRFSHKMRGNPANYIIDPKESGYRGVHLVFQFHSSQGRQPDSRCWDGLNIEVQLRTELQHAWATGVEIVGTMRGENLKAGQGNKKWLELFQYLSSIIALLEDQPVLPQHRKKDLDAKKLFHMAYSLSENLKAEDTIQAWVTAIEGTTNDKKLKNAYYNILRIDRDKRVVHITGFRKDKLEDAVNMLSRLEEEQSDLQPVLVAAGDIKSLKRAYPNYFIDAGRLLEILRYIDKTVKDDV